MQSETTVSIRAIDYRSGVERERWDSTPREMPYAGRFFALGASLQADVARYAALLGAGDGRHHPPAFVTVPGVDRVLYGIGAQNGGDGDDWQIADRSGAVLRRFAPSLVASYGLAFSSDGARVAWSGCCFGSREGSRYHVYTSTLGGRPVRVAPVHSPSAPVFARDNETFYFAAGPRANETCLVKASVRDPTIQTALHCERSGSDAARVALLSDNALAFLTPTAARTHDVLTRVEVRGASPSVSLRLRALSGELDVLDDHRVYFSSGVDLTIADFETRSVRTLGEAALGGFVSDATVVRDGGAPFFLAIRREDQRGTYALVRFEAPE
jgi:hypothetical protein